jgi:hypothetical protein
MSDDLFSSLLLPSPSLLPSFLLPPSSPPFLSPLPLPLSLPRVKYSFLLLGYIRERLGEEGKRSGEEEIREI